jgi:hypothetical protein
MYQPVKGAIGNGASYVINGFMKYANRNDLFRYLTKLNIQPLKTDGILDYRHTPTGSWVLSFSEDKPLVLPPSAISSSTNPNSTIVLEDNIVMKKIPETEHWRLMLTSQLDITDKTICLHTVPPFFNIDHIRQVFDGYDIAPNGIRPWAPKRSNSSTCAYLVDFTSSAEAERACRENATTVHDGASMRITWYNI